jgi:hypothetical protein
VFILNTDASASKATIFVIKASTFNTKSIGKYGDVRGELLYILNIL